MTPCLRSAVPSRCLGALLWVRLETPGARALHQLQGVGTSKTESCSNKDKALFCFVRRTMCSTYMSSNLYNSPAGHALYPHFSDVETEAWRD